MLLLLRSLFAAVVDAMDDSGRNRSVLLAIASPAPPAELSLRPNARLSLALVTAVRYLFLDEAAQQLTGPAGVTIHVGAHLFPHSASEESTTYGN
jgi:hypothetical protein